MWIPVSPVEMAGILRRLQWQNSILKKGQATTTNGVPVRASSISLELDRYLVHSDTIQMKPSSQFLQEPTLSSYENN
jgi:hypothetical protein